MKNVRAHYSILDGDWVFGDGVGPCCSEYNREISCRLEIQMHHRDRRSFQENLIRSQFCCQHGAAAEGSEVSYGRPLIARANHRVVEELAD